ncbi:MAG: hypothetical protein KIT10_00695 [Flavobacteriales bacterium]|nr:hypothetical protein [Flavobacteriales bacterium]
MEVHDVEEVLQFTGYREHYIRDAQGNIMAVYRYQNTGSMSFKVTERHLYGSSRLGTYTREAELYGLTTMPGPHPQPIPAARLRYELTDHLGNVTTVVTGRLLDGAGAGSPFQAEVISAQGYEPFGSLLPGRNYSSDAYRFGFNGQEKDNEVYGSEGTSYTAEFWQYDPRVGRRWNIDPMSRSCESPYAVFSNNPIVLVDPNGLKVKNSHKEEKDAAQKNRDDAKGKLDGLLASPVDKGNKEAYKGYQAAVKDARGALKSAESALSTATENFNAVEQFLNQYAFTDPEGYSQLDNLMDPSGNVVDVFVGIDPSMVVTLAQMTDGGGMQTGGGHHGKSEVHANVYTFQDGVFSHYTIKSRHGDNTVHVSLARKTTALTVAHEKGHVMYLVHNMMEHTQWQRLNPNAAFEDHHGPGDPSGQAADEEERRYKALERSRGLMPSGFVRP